MAMAITKSNVLARNLLTASTSRLVDGSMHKLLGATQSMHAENLTSVRHYANASATSEDQDCSEEIKELHGKFRAEVEGKRTVPVSLLRNILEQCKSPQDTGVAYRVLQDYRVYRSSKNRVKQNFNDNISSLAVLASLRTKSYDLGLKCLWEHNVYGLSPTLENAHKFLGHAKEIRDIDLMKKAYRTMLKNSLIPTTQTADIMIRVCKEKGDLQLMFDLAQEFLENGIKLSSSVFDILISTAASFGSVENIFKAQKWREEAGLKHTVASVFAVAKAHVLEGKPLVGADLVAAHCQDKVKLNKYLSMLVKVWPSELFARKDQINPEQDALPGLKENVVSFAKALSKKFFGVKINADEEFGKGNPKLKDDGSEDFQPLSAVS